MPNQKLLAKYDLKPFEEIVKSVKQGILSNLIYEGKIKGYISFKHNKLVISKDFKVAFPRLTTITQAN